MTRWNRWIGWVIVAVVAADWLSKFLVLNWVPLYEKVAVLEGWLYFVRLQNRGIAFSMFSDSAAIWRTPLLIAGAAIAIVTLVGLARSMEEPRGRLGIALVLGGALGNLGDRIANGAVTDFVMFSFFPYVFNVADAAIVVGGIILAIALARPRLPNDAMTV
jgi:signal peptidase II